MTTQYWLFKLIFCACVIQINSLQCRQCSSEDYNSPCRLGTEENLRTCTIEGEDHCYEEYLIGGTKRNGDYVPLYRRGCAPGNWCSYQQNNHYNDLKYCRVCQGDKCNDYRIGAANSSMLECHACLSHNGKSPCRYGYKCDFSYLCPADKNRCVEQYVVTGPHAYSPRYKSMWKRGCGTEDFCSEQRAKWGNALVECSACKRDMCNTSEFPDDY